jgi:hypothetical protein
LPLAKNVVFASYAGDPTRLPLAKNVVFASYAGDPTRLPLAKGAAFASCAWSLITSICYSQESRLCQLRLIAYCSSARN